MRLLLCALLSGCGGTSSPAGPADAALAAWDGFTIGPIDAARPPPGFGATVVPGSGVLFRLWAPHASAARVTGDFAGAPIEMIAEGAGVFRAQASGAQAGDTYGYTLSTPEGPLDRLDPYCRELAGDRCRVIGKPFTLPVVLGAYDAVVLSR